MDMNKETLRELFILPLLFGYWRIGKAFIRNGVKYRTLFYRDVWVAVLKDDEHLIENIMKVIYNPHPRVTLLRMWDGVLKSHEIVGDKNIEKVRILFNNGYLSAEEAEQRCPKLRRWLVKNKYIESKRHTPVKVEKLEDIVDEQMKIANLEREDETEVDNIKYFRNKSDWYRTDVYGNFEPIPKRKYFRSVWEARVQYCKDRASMEDVARYSWGAIFEVVHDIMYRATEEEQLSKEFKQEIRDAIYPLTYIQPQIAKFTRNSASGALMPIYDIDPVLLRDPGKQAQFFNLLEEVLDGKISGYCAHLQFTNGHYSAIQKETQRWNKNRTVYVPGLRQKRFIIMNNPIEYVRDYLQALYVDMLAMGLRPDTEFRIQNGKTPITSFVYEGNKYGLNLETGALFSMISETDRYIPRNFYKWDEEKKRQYLKEDYDLMVEAFDRRSRGCYQHYYQLKASGTQARTAWCQAVAYHAHLSKDFIKRNRAASRWACSHANKTAKVVKIELPIQRRSIA